MRKIHLQPQVLRPTSPRNISPILNPELATSARNLTTRARNACSPGIPPKPCPICAGPHWKSDCSTHLAATPSAPGTLAQGSLTDSFLAYQLKTDAA
ncbi:hypothetical protein CK820_G0036428 [Pan troglodytes]|uniref:Uncharacterized protein n=1 Tax=Pan troglodytes TaxID=9598 RepID=A0A2J8KTB9_PANTR|nr:hypothetical protein CK820_G0036428 [Pan troglodytes]